MAIDIGTLAGRIEFEDHVTTTLNQVLAKVDAMEERFGSLGGRIAESAAGFMTAEVAIRAVNAAMEFGVGILRDLTMEGARIDSIADNFDALTAGAGRLSSTLLNELRAGTRETITDLELMKLVNSDLAAGMNLTDAQFRTMADGAYALAQVTGGDVATALETVNDALLTGRTRSVQALTGKIDLTAAEEKFAQSLGVTADRLSEEGKLQAARIAILDAVGAATARIGEQTDGLDTKVDQVMTSWSNWYNELSRSVATSPAVVAAFDAIKEAITDAFGGDTEDLLNTVVGWIETGAEAVRTYGPAVIAGFVTVKDWVLDIYNTVRQGWNLLPDWFKNISSNALLTAGALAVANTGVSVATGGLTDLAGAAATVVSGMKDLPELLSLSGRGLTNISNLIKILDFSSLANAGASLSLIGSSALSAVGPLGAVALAIGSIWAAWELGKSEAVSDFFMDLGLRVQGYTEEQRRAMIETDKMVAAQRAQAEAAQQQREFVQRAKDMMNELSAAANANTIALDNNTDAVDRNKLILEQTAEEARKMREAMAELQSIAGGWRETLASMDEELVKSIKHYLEAGASQSTLATAYKLTAGQVTAVANALKEEQEAFKLEQRALNDSAARWAEYHSLVVATSGNATEKLLADIEAWEAAQIRSRKNAKTDTADFYLWLEQMSKQMFEAESQRRLEQDVNSRAYWEAQAREAREAYEFALAHSDQFTQGHINNLKLASEAAAEAARNWRNHLGGALDAVSEKVGVLQHKMADLSETTRTMGGSFEINRSNLAENARYWGIPESVAMEMAKRGFSFQEMIAAWQSGTVKDWVPSGPKIPGFRDGGIGDFGEGTLAVLHGKEAIVPLDKQPLPDGMFGNVTNHFYVNGTAQEVARKISDEIMRTLKAGRQFGAA